MAATVQGLLTVLEGQPYRIRTLLVHGASLLTSWPQTPIWRKTLAGLEFLVSIDRQLTADAAWADIVLPATTMFEIESYMTYGPIFRIREKIIEPVGRCGTTTSSWRSSRGGPRASSRPRASLRPPAPAPPRPRRRRPARSRSTPR